MPLPSKAPAPQRSLATPLYTILLPAAALAFAAVVRAGAIPGVSPDSVPGPVALVATLLLIGAAISTLAHSDLVADRLGQPFGTLILTLSVTIIEVSVIASIMLYGENNPTLARESVFSVIMIACTGIVGLCLFLGSLKHHEQEVQQQGTAAFLSVIIALGVLLLILPNDTRAGGAGEFSPLQLMFVSAVAIALYGAFLYMQTVRHKDHFVTAPPRLGEKPPPRAFLVSLVMLVLSLSGVVALSSYVAAGVEDFLAPFHLVDPDAVTGALVALMLLMPEGLTAVRAARRNHLQLSLNVALGSALATIALTIPAMAAISVIIGRPIVLGLDAEDRTMLLLTFVISLLSFGTGKTNVLTGLVHLIVFFVYVMLLFAP